jgi:hypothetical protein
MIYIDLDNSVVELGKSVTGIVRCQSGQSSQKPLIVKVKWHTEGRGSKQKQTVVTLDLGKLSAGSVIPFRCDLPYEAPVSFDGKLFRVIWFVKAEVRGLLMSGETQTVPIQVIPRRKHL